LRYIEDMENKDAAVKAGDTVRVIVTEPIERFPHFIAPVGSGTLIDADDNGAWIKYDETIPGCEEWENEVYVESAEMASVVRLSEPGR